MSNEASFELLDSIGMRDKDRRDAKMDFLDSSITEKKKNIDLMRIEFQRKNEILLSAQKTIKELDAKIVERIEQVRIQSYINYKSKETVDVLTKCVNDLKPLYESNKRSYVDGFRIKYRLLGEHFDEFSIANEYTDKIKLDIDSKLVQINEYNSTIKIIDYTIREDLTLQRFKYVKEVKILMEEIEKLDIRTLENELYETQSYFVKIKSISKYMKYSDDHNVDWCDLPSLIHNCNEYHQESLKNGYHVDETSQYCETSCTGWTITEFVCDCGNYSSFSWDDNDMDFYDCSFIEMEEPYGFVRWR